VGAGARDEAAERMYWAHVVARRVDSRVARLGREMREELGPTEGST